MMREVAGLFKNNGPKKSVRHYEIKHRAKYAELTGQERTNKVDNVT